MSYNYYNDMEIIAQRTFNMAYIWLDVIFLVVFIVLLLMTKRRLTLLWSIFGGVLYFVVDYGIFYLALESRSIYIAGQLQGNGGTALVLLWMSMSYGMTNFGWIWLALRKDEFLKEFSLLIFGWWIVCPIISKIFSTSAEISTVRTTGQYHGIMGLILIISYLVVIIYNMRIKDKRMKVRVLWLCVIGVLIQFAWEAALLIGGIRSHALDVSFAVKLQTLIINSLVETNLGMPLIFLIFLFINSKRRENLSSKKSNMKYELIKINRG